MLHTARKSKLRSASPVTTNLTITPASIAKSLLTVVALLLIANLAFLFLEHHLGWNYHSVDIFYFNKEGNIPTVYSSLAILIAAAFLWLISRLPNEKKSKHYWRFLALVFVFLSLDELLSIHETLTDDTRQFLGSNATGFFHFAWIIPYLILCVILASTLFRFLSMLPHGTRYLFIIAAQLLFLAQ